MRTLALYTCVFITLLMPVSQLSAQGKNFIKGLQGKDSLSVDRVWAASMLVPGYGQAYNKQYWKIPVLYAGLASTLYAGIHYNNKQQDAWGKYQAVVNSFPPLPSSAAETLKSSYESYKLNRNLAYVGAALFYVAGALDAVWQYKTEKPIVPAKPTIYSVLVPGLGQIYNKHYWKVPIIYGGFALCFYNVNFNNIQYQRYKEAYNNISDGLPDEFRGQYTPDNLRYIRDGYRRNRDLSMLMVGVVYALNIVDAHVFAHLADYDVSDKLSMRFEPTLLDASSFASLHTYTPTVGFNLTITLK